MPTVLVPLADGFEEIEALAPDVVLLPDEPYVFGEADRSAFSRPTELISGRLITWYGPSLVEAAGLAGT